MTPLAILLGAIARRTSPVRILQGDCRDVLATLPDNSVDSVVTDPPYGLSFMGKAWDYDVPQQETWREVFRVLKPGGHMLAFFGSRTYHRGAVAIEDAGFEIRDQIMWLYGSGFPKSLDVSKAIDKAAGAEREVVGFDPVAAKRTKAIGTAAYGDFQGQNGAVTAPATEAARQWEGWGTALKPAHEPVVVARKPLIGTVAENVQRHGTGAINIDGCRVGDEVLPAQVRGVLKIGTFESADGNETPERTGRWPANVIHDGSDEVVAGFPQTGTESAARYFYCAKASKADRDAGLDDEPIKEVHRYGAGLGEGKDPNAPALNKNHHPTVKPTELMRYLCRLVTPPGGVVLDPFMGSGSTGRAARLEGFKFIGIELSPDYVAIAEKRIAEVGK